MSSLFAGVGWTAKFSEEQHQEAAGDEYAHRPCSYKEPRQHASIFSGKDFEGDVRRNVTEGAGDVEGKGPLPFPSDGDANVEVAESGQDGLRLERPYGRARRPLAAKGQVGGDWREMRLTAAVGRGYGLDEDGEDQKAGLRFRGPYGHGDVVPALLFAVNEQSAIGRDAAYG